MAERSDRTLGIKRSYFKLAGLLVFFSACVLIVHFTPLKILLEDFSTIRSFVADSGLWAPLIFFGLSTVSIFVGAPRLPFCVLGGMLFGFVLGLLLSQLATLVGAFGPYLLARRSGPELSARRLERLGRFQRLGRAVEFLDEPTVFNVFLLRQVPITGVFINLCLGSIGVPVGTFVVGSLLGFLPQGAIFTLVGSGVVEESLQQALSRIWLGILVLGLAALAISRAAFRGDAARALEAEE